MNSHRDRASALRKLLTFSLLFVSSGAAAKRFDIHGPPGSAQFGGAVAVLPNGNIVVGDFAAKNGTPVATGAVYLFDSAGNLISTLTGSSDGDYVGEYIAVLPNGNFVAISPKWHNGASQSAGAVTWIDGTHGLSGAVSAQNSLVGTHTGDSVGSNWIATLANGNFVVASPYWNGNIGAVTWVNGANGIAGAVSASNSLTGSTPGDFVGARNSRGIFPLANGNYVVGSPEWQDASGAPVGAATWVDGSQTVGGIVSASNSLIGSTSQDNVGYYVAALTNGNYVVASPSWSDGGTPSVGAATWADGGVGLVGVVSTTNSLTGTSAQDDVAFGCGCSAHPDGIAALANGNYVVVSAQWNNGTPRVGAVTWASGSTGLVGPVSAQNSLIGSEDSDRIGYNGIAALTNGNYVFASQFWNGGATQAGAVTWGNGSSGSVGVVSAQNSLIGANGDQVGIGGVVALSNGNYVAASPLWNNATGAVTLGNGATGSQGLVSTGNSLVGTSQGDEVGYPVYALKNGNYVVSSPQWAGGYGAATWADGTTGLVGTVSLLNSLSGSSYMDHVGLQGVSVFSDGNYAVNSGSVDGQKGAVTFGYGRAPQFGSITDANSVIGGVVGGGTYLVSAYDPVRYRLIVGRPDENMITVWDTDALFADGFEP